MKSLTLDAYYRAELLYVQVQEILRVDDHDPQDAKAIQLADLLLSVAQADRILRNKNEADGGVLGVTSPLLHHTTGLRDSRILHYHRDAARHAVLPRVEEKLRTKCHDIGDIVLSELLDRARPLASAASLADAPPARQVMEIPTLIVELQSLTTQRKTRSNLLTRQLRKQLVEDLGRLKAMISTVQKLLVLYKQHDAPRVLQVKMEWLVAYSQAMHVRAKVLANQVHVETYTPDRIALLASIHDALEERRRRATEEREQLQAKLHLYCSADSEYQAIAREYACVLQSIGEKKKWLQSLEL